MYQQLIIIGNLGNEPELRYTAGGVPVASFNVAVNRRWTKEDGSPGEETTWFRVSAWRKLGEICAQYLHKGRQVLVIGRVSARAYTTSDGEQRASLEVTALDVRFLGASRNEEGSVTESAEDEEAFF
jgi:single-strand DNA-binding protein